MDLPNLIQQNITKAALELWGISVEKVVVEHPENTKWGDYASSIALTLSKVLKQSPKAIATELCSRVQSYTLTFNFNGQDLPIFTNIYVAEPGFINFVLSQEWLNYLLIQVSSLNTHYG